MQSMFDERLWLAWLAKVRIVILTFLLAIELGISLLTPSALPLRLFVGTMLGWYAVAIFYLTLLSFWREQRLQSLLQVLTDMAMITLVVYATGGVDSSLNFLYALAIIVGSILLPRSWAFLSAALAFILYGTILELTYFAVVPSHQTTHPGLVTLQAIILVNLFAFLAVAYLASLLSAKLRQVDVRLKYTSGALQNLQALHEDIIQAISGGLITTGLEGHITLVNRAAEALLERPEQELVGQRIQQIFLDPLPEAGNKPAHAEVRFVAQNEFRRTFRVMVSELKVPERGALGYVYTFDDLTEIRRLEREVRMQDRLAAVGRLAAAIAHEIRNPLTSIAGSVSMLGGIPDLSEEHRQLLRIVTRESERLNAIITDFLNYSRGKQYKFASVDLVPLIEDTLTLLQHRLKAENSGIVVERKFDVPQAWVVADGDKLKQVFWNFCENAIRAMAGGGTLRVSLQAENDEWQASFADTGPGMRQQLIEKIFEPFQSEFVGGTGLGLAIVYQIVQAHEGKVWARSKLGHGSVFVLRLRRLGTADAVPGSLAVVAGKSAAQGVAGAAAAARGGRAHG